MAEGNNLVEKHWLVEYEEQTDIGDMRFSTDTDALNFIAELRKLGDPAYSPTAIVCVTKTTSTDVVVIPLQDPAVDVGSVVAYVKEQFHKDPNVIKDGGDAIAWAVAKTLEALDQ